MSLRNISITSSDVIANYNKLLKQTHDPTTDQKLTKVKNSQYAYEQKLINSISVCNNAVLNALRDHLSGLNSHQLDEYISNQFQNPAVMKAAKCTIDSVFNDKNNNRIRYYITNLQQINSSINNYILTADFENAKDLLVIKVAKTPLHDNLLHELIVGLHGTNHLRQYVPNFIYVYGGFKCSPPLINPESKKVVTYCLSGENAVNYILYENVGNNQKFDTYLQKCSGQQFLNIYMQIVYALRIANLAIDFTHYDLHPGNVALRFPENNNAMFQIPYDNEYLTTNVVATIIDYGYAQIRCKDMVDSMGHLIEKGQHLGRSGLIPFSVYPYRSWIFHDLYKLLMFSLLLAHKYNNKDVINVASKIFRFFNKTEDIVVALHLQEPTRFGLPLSDLNIDEYITFIKKVCDCDFISNISNNLPILNCQRMCLNADAILKDIGIDPNDKIATPDNIIEFYDIVIRLQNENKEDEKAEIIADFNYPKCIQEHISKMKLLVKNLISLRNKLKLVDIANMTVHEVLTYDTMMLVRSMYIIIAEIIDKSADLQFYYDIGIATVESYNDDAAKNNINYIMDQFNSNLKPSLDEIKRILGSNNNYLNKIESDLIVTTSLQRDSRLNWYWNERKLFDIAFGRVVIDVK